jgi:hypothetical protein
MKSGSIIVVGTTNGWRPGIGYQASPSGVLRREQLIETISGLMKGPERRRVRMKNVSMGWVQPDGL